MRFERFARWLYVRLMLSIERDPDFVIGGRDDPYMKRWFLIPRNPLFNVYFHLFLRSDDDRALHDHPWPSVSLMLHGRCIEHTKDGARQLRAGDVRFRSPWFAHRIELMPCYHCATLFITGPRIREWGFYCQQGWVHWKQFTAFSQSGDSSTIGKGCSE